MPRLKNGFAVVIGNLAVFVFLLASIETGSYFYLKINGDTGARWLFSPPQEQRESEKKLLEDNCLRMKTHPFYSHTHDHNGKCVIKDGKAYGPFVYYSPEGAEYGVLTLGGSTTDGFYYHISDGDTWPALLSRRLTSEAKANFEVINGGAGGYGSSQELLKLLIDGGRVHEKLKYVISLSGINEIAGYRGLNDAREKAFPFWNQILLRMFSQQTWIQQDKPTTETSKYFPSAMKIIATFVAAQTPPDSGSELALRSRNPKQDDAAAQWFYNVRMMRAVSNEIGAEFFVFLQPTLGLADVSPPQDRSSPDYKLLALIDAEYSKKINDLYAKLHNYCALLTYCYDFSSVAPPTGDVYHDPRHHNAKGNKIIADKIYEALFQK
jgi:lysophospholipase L1-like esterase